MSVYLLPSTSPFMNMPLEDVVKVNYYSYTELSQERERERERKIEIGTFKNFAKTRGSGENPKQTELVWKAFPLVSEIFPGFH